MDSALASMCGIPIDEMPTEEFAEVIVPLVAQTGKQFIGCLIPVEHKKIGFVSRAARTFREMGGCPTIVNKVMGLTNKKCLSVMFTLPKHHSKEDLELEADGLCEVIEHLFGITCTFVSSESSITAKLRLG